MEADLVIRSVMLPAAAMGVAAAILTLFAGRTGARARGLALALLPIVAVLPAFRALAVQEGGLLASGLPSSVSYGWLPSSALVAACCAAAVTGAGSRASMLAASVVAPFAAMALVAPPGFRGGEAQFVAAAVASVAAAVSARCVTEAAGACGRPPRAEFASWWLVLSIASGFAILAGFAKLAFVAASLAASSAALGTLSIGIRGIRPGPAVAITFATALAALSFVGMAYDEAPLPRTCWVILALSPAGAAFSLLPGLRRHPRARSAVRLAAPAVLAAAALLAALAAVRAGRAGRTDDASTAAPDAATTWSARP